MTKTKPGSEQWSRGRTAGNVRGEKPCVNNSKRPSELLSRWEEEDNGNDGVFETRDDSII